MRSLSLRARLVLGLLSISAVGLVVLGAVTYASQRNFLQDRIDEQARTGLPAIGRELDEALGLDGVRSGGRFRRPGGPGGDLPLTNVPPGTYGERISPSGEVLTQVVSGYTQADAIDLAGRPARQATSGRRR